MTAATAKAQMWLHLHPLRNAIHEQETNSYFPCKILYSGLFLEFNVEWIVLVVINPAKEFYFSDSSPNHLHNLWKLSNMEHITHIFLPKHTI
jgi:hypothetical protein